MSFWVQSVNMDGEKCWSMPHLKNKVAAPALKDLDSLIEHVPHPHMNLSARIWITHWCGVPFGPALDDEWDTISC